MAETRFERVFAVDPNRVKLPPRTQVPQQQFLPQKSQSAAAFSQLGSDIFTAGGTLAQIGAVNQARDEDREAQALEVGAEQRIRDAFHRQGGMLDQEGAAAIEYEKEVFNPEIENILRTTVTNNPGIQLRLDARLNNVRNRAYNKSATHITNQRNKAEIATDVTQRGQFLEYLSENPTDPQAIAEFAALNQKILSRSMTDPTLIKFEQQKLFSTAYRNIITNMIDNGDLPGAQSLLDNTITIDGEEMSIKKILLDKDEAAVTKQLELRNIDLQAQEGMQTLAALLPSNSTEADFNKEAEKLKDPAVVKALKLNIKDHFATIKRVETQAVLDVKQILTGQAERGEPLNLTAPQRVIAEDNGLISAFRKLQRNLKDGSHLPTDPMIYKKVTDAIREKTFHKLNLYTPEFIDGLGPALFIQTVKEQDALIAAKVTDSNKLSKEHKANIVKHTRFESIRSALKPHIETFGLKTDQQIADFYLTVAQHMEAALQRDPKLAEAGVTDSRIMAIAEGAAAEVRVKSGLFGWWTKDIPLAEAIINGAVTPTQKAAAQAVLNQKGPISPAAKARAEAVLRGVVISVAENDRLKKRIFAETPSIGEANVGTIVDHLIANKILPTPITVTNFMRYQRRKVAAANTAIRQAEAARLLTFPEFDDRGIPVPTTAVPTTPAPAPVPPTTAAPVPVATSTQPVVTAAGTPTSQATSLDIAKQARKNVVDRISTSRSPLSAPLTRERVEALIKAETKSLKQRVKDQQELDKLMEISAATPAQKAASLERFKRERIATIKGQERIKELERQHRAGEVTPLGGRRGGTPLSPDVERLLQEFSNDKLPEGGRSFFPDPSRAPEFPQAPDVTERPALAGVPQREPFKLGTKIVGTTPEGRPIIQNPDGSRSTERSATRETDKGFVNFPTIHGAKLLSEDEAFDIVKEAGFTDPETGRKLNFFKTLDAAEAAAAARSKKLGQEAIGEDERLLQEFRNLGEGTVEWRMPEETVITSTPAKARRAADVVAAKFPTPENQLIADEGGRRADVYTDSEGLPTAGIGHQLTEERAKYFRKHPEELTLELINQWFKEDLAKATAIAKKVLDDPAKINPQALNIITNMAFNMGLGRKPDPTKKDDKGKGLKSFVKMLTALNNQDYETAAAEMKPSKWATQVGARATRLVAIMKNIEAG